jgi:hypothetical protein
VCGWLNACAYEIDDDEGNRLLRTIRRSAGSVVTWRRAQMVLLSAHGMSVPKMAEVTFSSADRVRDVIHDLPFSTWSLTKLADFLVAEGVVDDISHEGLRMLLREEGVSFQRLKTFKTSRDPDYAAKKARVEHLYALADGEVIFCLDEFGPLNLQPHPGRQWAGRGGKHKDPERQPRPRMRATYNRYGGVRHLFAAYDLPKTSSTTTSSPPRTARSAWSSAATCAASGPPRVRIATMLDNFSPHLTTKKCRHVADWAAANNVEVAYTPTNSSWAQPHRSPVHRAALLRPGQHRPPQPQGAGQHDPPQHHLAEPPRRRHPPTSGRRPSQPGLTSD